MNDVSMASSVADDSIADLSMASTAPDDDVDPELRRLAAMADDEDSQETSIISTPAQPRKRGRPAMTDAEKAESRRLRKEEAIAAEDPQETEARMKKLKFLLQKSSIYASIMQQKMDGEREKRRVAEEKKAKAEAAAASASASTAAVEDPATAAPKTEEVPTAPKEEAPATEAPPPVAAVVEGDAAPAAAATADAEADEGLAEGRSTRAGEAHEKPLVRSSRRTRGANKDKAAYAVSDYIGEADIKAAKEAAKRDSAGAKGKAAKGKGPASANPSHDERQPRLVTGAVMREYQLVGLEWLVSLYENGLNGILADEMGLGKTLQTISFFAHLRENNTYGPFLVVAPKSTCRNWLREFEKFTPDIPAYCYMGTKIERAAMRARDLRMPKALAERQKFPVVITSFETAITDRAALSQHKWKYIVVDEGHRLKNLECQLIKELKKYSSANRLILSGTPLHNNLKELWSLLNFILPDVFDDLATFEQWFDFSDIHEEGGTNNVLGKDSQVALIGQLHEILKPFLLRRMKEDVEELPPKKEYLLYAPLTISQKELYDEVVDGKIRKALLERKTGLRFDDMAKVDPGLWGWARIAKPQGLDSDEESIAEASPPSSVAGPSAPPSLFSTPAPLLPSRKRDRSPTGFSMPTTPAEDSDYEDRSGTRKAPRAKKVRVRAAKGNVNYTFEESEHDFIERIENGIVPETYQAHMPSKAEQQRAGMLYHIKQARQQINNMHLENTAMQLRKICCHPFLFDWPTDKNGYPVVNEDLINASGKMLMLNRLLDALFATNHKVLIFSQFTTCIDIIQDWATDFKKLRVFRIDGNTSLDDREEQMRMFNNETGPDACNLFLLSTRAGGLGINLIAADTVIFYDSDWNPQADLQAQDRVHRIGQTKPVLIFRLVAGNTFEQKILRRAQAKRHLEKIVIQEDKFRGVSNSAVKALRGGRAKMTLNDAIEKLEAEKVQLAGKDDKIISDENLAKLLDRSPAAYARQKGWVTDRSGQEIADGVKEDQEAHMAFEVTETRKEDDDEEDDALKQLFGGDDSGPGRKRKM